MLTPEEIQAREFLVSLRGYDRDEVHAFLDRVAEQMRALQTRLEQAGRDPVDAPERADASGMFAQISSETNRILEAAQEAGAAIQRTARQEADRVLQAARAEAARVIAEGERRREAVEELVQELEAVKAQLAEDLRGVGRSIEGSMRDLLGEEVGASSVREALAAEALPDDAELPEAAPEEPTGESDEFSPEPLATPLEGPSANGDGPQAPRQALLSPLNQRLVRQIKRGLHDVQNVVLDRLRRAGGHGELDGFVPTEAEMSDFAAGATDVLDEAYEAGRDGAARLAGRELPAPAEGRDLAADFLDDAADRIRGGLAANLRMGLEVGEELAALSGRVSAVLGEVKQSTDEWATTHLIRCYELGQLDAWVSGGLTHREWVVGPEPRCPEGRCRHNGQTGVLPVAEAYPSGHLTPPVHAGCTCTIVPVTDELPAQ